MGSSQSSSSHFAHREGKHHRFQHVGGNRTQGPCGMCSQSAELGVEVYRCRACGFLLHADCYGRPERIHDHFAHPGHPLTLSGGHPLAAGRQCNICAVAFDAGGRPSYFVYGCDRCRGFYAHHRCAALPRTMVNHALHPHTLTLLSPPRWPHGGGRRCLNAAGGCRNASRGGLANDARSYQCNLCNVEVCLACQLPGGGPNGDEQKGCGDFLGTMGVVVQQLGTATGTSLRALCCACIGAPMAAPALPPPATTK